MSGKTSLIGLVKLKPVPELIFQASKLIWTICIHAEIRKSVCTGYIVTWNDQKASELTNAPIHKRLFHFYALFKLLYLVYSQNIGEKEVKSSIGLVASRRVLLIYGTSMMYQR